MSERKVQVILEAVPRGIDQVAKQLQDKLQAPQVGSGIAPPKSAMPKFTMPDNLKAVGQSFKAGFIGQSNDLVGGIGKMIGPMAGGFARVAGVMGRVAAVAGPVGIVIAGVAAAFGKLVETAGKIVTTVVSLAAKASPVAFERFRLAIDDTQAVLGRVLVPLMDHWTRIIRLVADVLATVLPTQSQVAEVFRELDPVFKSLRESFAEVAPLIRDQLVIYLKMGAIVLKSFADSVKLVIDSAKASPIVQLALWLRKKMRGDQADDGLANSTGASQFGGVSFKGAEEFAKSSWLATLSAQSINPMDALPPKVDETNMLLRQLIAASIPGPASYVASALVAFTGNSGGK